MNNKPDDTLKSNEDVRHITCKCDLNCSNCDRLKQRGKRKEESA